MSISMSITVLVIVLVAIAFQRALGYEFYVVQHVHATAGGGLLDAGVALKGNERVTARLIVAISDHFGLD
jgi:hypothetical protein